MTALSPHQADAPPPRLSGRNRYSIFVGCMKVVLPATAAALILLIVVWPQLDSGDSRFRIRVSDLSAGLADNLSMLNARFDGLDDKNQPFSVTADEASQTPGLNNIIDLAFPKADITLEDGAWLAVEAQEGTYDRDSKVLKLSGNVSLFHDKGYELTTDNVRVDLEASIAEGFEIVTGQGPFGSIESQGFRVLERGEQGVFHGQEQDGSAPRRRGQPVMARRPWGPIVLLAALGLLAGPPSAAVAQGLDELKGGDEPLEITADDGIEWRRNDKVYIARGNARAAQGDLAVLAEVLTARYRTGADGAVEIFRIEAEGDVRMVSPDETIYAESGIYDVDKGVLVLKGDNLKLETAEDVITARDSLEYWQADQIAVARGDAMARRGDTELRADLLTAYFKSDEDDQLAINTVRADGGVEIVTADEYATGETGIYYVAQELATLTGKVKITRGDNQLNGEYAEVNLKTGVSRLLGAPPGVTTGDTRVRGLLLPEAETQNGGS